MILINDMRIIVLDTQNFQSRPNLINYQSNCAQYKKYLSLTISISTSAFAISINLDPNITKAMEYNFTFEVHPSSAQMETCILGYSNSICKLQGGERKRGEKEKAVLLASFVAQFQYTCIFYSCVYTVA